MGAHPLKRSGPTIHRHDIMVFDVLRYINLRRKEWEQTLPCPIIALFSIFFRIEPLKYNAYVSVA